MSQYEVGKKWFFPELGLKPEIGDVVELSDEAAERYMHNEPGLLKLVRKTTQASPSVARKDAPTKRRLRR